MNKNDFLIQSIKDLLSKPRNCLIFDKFSPEIIYHSTAGSIQGNQLVHKSLLETIKTCSPSKIVIIFSHQNKKRFILQLKGFYTNPNAKGPYLRKFPLQYECFMQISWPGKLITEITMVCSNTHELINTVPALGPKLTHFRTNLCPIPLNHIEIACLSLWIWGATADKTAASLKYLPTARLVKICRNIIKMKLQLTSKKSLIKWTIDHKIFEPLVDYAISLLGGIYSF